MKPYVVAEGLLGPVLRVAMPRVVEWGRGEGRRISDTHG